jgi:hypothetical protein
MSKGWSFISNIGLQESYDGDLKKRIVLHNNINALACVVYFTIGIIYFAFQDNTTAIFIESLIGLNILSFYAQKKHYHTFSLSFFLVSGYLSIFYFDSYAGLESGAFLYYLPVLISLFFLFDVKNDKNVIAIHALVIAVLIIVHQFTNRTLFKSDVMTDVMKSRLLMANIILSLVSVIYFVFLALKKNQIK